MSGRTRLTVEVTEQELQLVQKLIDATGFKIPRQEVVRKALRTGLQVLSKNG